jgi:SNF2 family DNA or RNA helicase
MKASPKMSLNNVVKVGYDQKTKRLIMTYPFYMADMARNFPSRRFNPKDKTWRMPLVRANINHLNDSQKHVQYEFTDEAKSAIDNCSELMAKPVYQPFPYHLYDFKKSAAKHMPMEHQRKLLDKSWNLPVSAWFAKMGTGKTFAAIHLACARFAAGLIDSVVIICPSTLRTVWRKEFAKYATVEYDFRVHETSSRTIRDFYNDRQSGVLQVLAVSVEGLGVSEALFDSVCGFFPHRTVMVIVDESSRIKNPDALRTNRTIKFQDASKYRIILNGTPIALGIQDLWPQYEFLDPNIIGSGDYWSFKTRYLVMGGYEQKQIVGAQNVEELMRLIEPYTVEVGKDVLDLPPKVPVVRPVQMSPEQKSLLRLIKKGTSPDPDAPLIKVDNVLERVLRWRQVVGGWLPRMDPVTEEVTLEPLKSNPKMDSLFEIIEDNYAGSKFIIWSSFVHEIEYIANRLADKYGRGAVESYYGATEMDARSTIEDRYCRDSEMRFFVGNPATAGLGLTLVSDHNDVMVYYSGTNAYIDRAQSEDRAHRIGQLASVTVIDIVAEKTIDEVIIASIAEKMSIETYVLQRLANGPLDAMELTG